jgi:MFS family permease
MAPDLGHMRNQISRNVWVTGWVSFFMDISSEMVYPLVPLFLSSSLGASKSIVGLIEGVAESAASLLQLLSGRFADRSGKNKVLMAVGYGVSAASRPILAVATGWGMVLAARFSDRVGKGIRTPPRDAIIAASTPLSRLGLAFGFHRAMDQAGAVAGPAVALVILAFWHDDYRLVFWLSLLPGVLAVFLILGFIQTDGSRPSPAEPSFWSVAGMETRLWVFIIAVGLLSLGNSSNAFLILKAEHVGISPAWISGIYLLFNAVYALVSVPAGYLADRLGRRPVIAGGFVLFAGVYAGFALATSALHVAVLFILYGAYMGLTEGVQRAYLATLVPVGQRATGYGLYHMVLGLAIFPASVIAGFLWDSAGTAAPFWYGAGMAMLAAIVFTAASWREIPRTSLHDSV